MLPIVYMSNEQGAPILNNAAGSLISVLDAVLVNGFNSVGIFSITITDNVATVVTSAGHGLAVGNKITVAGVSITAATGVKEVASIVNSTTFTFPCVNANNTESPVSATIKRTPLGWAKIFNKTNVAMYKSTDVQAYGQSLRVDDTGTNAVTQGVRVHGVENPTSIDVWTDKFPLETQQAGGLFWAKGANTTAAKAWCIVGDERFFYFLVESSSYSSMFYPGGSAPNQYWSFIPHYFGDIISNKNSEGFGAIIGGNTTAPQNNFPSGGVTLTTALGSVPNSASNAFIARQFTGIAKSIAVGFVHLGGRVAGSDSYPRYPSPVANELTVQEPSFVVETLAYANHPIRGVLPGFASFLCNHTDLPQSNFPQRMTTTDGSNRTYLYAPYTASSTPSSPDSCFAVKLNEAWR